MIEYAVDKRVEQWLEENKEDILEKYISLCRIPSERGAPAPGKPFGEAVAEALGACRKMFSLAGFSAKEEDGCYITARHGDGARQIGIFAHADVVPGGGGWLFTEPFCPIISEGTLIGRGVSDNKSGIMAAYLLLRIFAELEIPLNSALLAFVGGCEETGMEDLAAYLKKEQEPDFCLVPDSRFPCCVGERGVYEFFAKCGTKLTGITDMGAGVTNNAVADSAYMCVPSSAALIKELRERAGEENIEIQYSNPVKITARGRAAHAAAPNDGINAMRILAEFAAGLAGLSAHDRAVMQAIARLLSDTDGTALGINMSDEIFGATSVANCLSYFEDGCPVLGFNIRYGDAAGAARIEKQIDAALKKYGFFCEKKNNKPPLVIKKDSPAVELFTEIYNEMSGLRSEQPFAIGGKTYASMLRSAIAVGTCVGKTPDGFNPGKELPKGHGGAHAPDEKIQIDGFFAAVRVLVQYIIAVDRSPRGLIEKIK